MIDTPESLARRVARLHEQGRSPEALALAEAAAQHFPQSPLSQANLGFLRVVARDYAGAREAYTRALRLNPQHAEARRGLAVSRRALGEEFHGDSISIVPFTGEGRAIELLVLLTLGEGNMVIDQIFDPALVRMTKLAVELHPPQEPLPEHDLLFNAIGDADSSQNALALAQELAARTARTVLNPPERIVPTGRAEQARRLARVAGVRVAEIRLIPRDALEWLELPVLVRSPGFHAGKHFERLETEADRAAANAALPPGDLFAIEYVDTRDESGLYAKYRVVAIDGRIYPVHLAFSHDWKVHYFSAEMESSAEYRAREARFLAGPRGELPPAAWKALEAIVERMQLDYVGVDFTLDRSGTVVVFECNATMAVRYPPQEPMWEYRRGAVDAIMDAMRRMIGRYSST